MAFRRTLNPEEIVTDEQREEIDKRLRERTWDAPAPPPKPTKAPPTEFCFPEIVTKDAWMTPGDKDLVRIRLRKAGLDKAADAFVLERERSLRTIGYKEVRAYEEAWLLMWTIFCPVVARYEAHDEERNRAVAEIAKEARQERVDAARLRREFMRFISVRDHIAKEIHRERNKALREIRKEYRRLYRPPGEPLPDLKKILNRRYKETNEARIVADSLFWAAMEYRRIIVPSESGYVVDYSRASRKPPTAMAVSMVEYFARCPNLLDRLYSRTISQFIRRREFQEAAEEAGLPPETLKEPTAAELYLRSIGLLPAPEEPDAN